jgi:Flp pilus assembly protein TadG
MMRPRFFIFADQSGSAAVELALSLPLLLVLMFGSLEVGNYFLSEHAVQKAVRDAARYGARLPMTDYPSCTVPAAGVAELGMQRLAKSGSPDGDYDGNGTQDKRLIDWTADNMTIVTINCSIAGSFNNSGIYKDFPAAGGVPGAAPVITVQATIPYKTFFGKLGLGASTVNLYAQSQAAVIGA